MGSSNKRVFLKRVGGWCEPIKTLVNPSLSSWAETLSRPEPAVEPLFQWSGLDLVVQSIWVVTRVALVPFIGN
jgi:hypothetical protein